MKHMLILLFLLQVATCFGKKSLEWRFKSQDKSPAKRGFHEMAELNIFSPDQAIETIPGPEGKEIINNRKLSKKPKKSSNKNSKRSKKTQWGSSNQMFT